MASATPSNNAETSLQHEERRLRIDIERVSLEERRLLIEEKRLSLQAAASSTAQQAPVVPVVAPDIYI